MSTATQRTIEGPTWLASQESVLRYCAGGYRPTMLGERLQEGRYEIFLKLGHGEQSTIWLASDTANEDTCVAIKIFAAQASEYAADETEIPALRRLASGPSAHPGYACVPHLLDNFIIESRYGKHLCVVSELLGCDVPELFKLSFVNAGRWYPEYATKRVIYDILLALDYAHTECNVIHTDLKLGNVLSRFDDKLPAAQARSAMADIPSFEFQDDDGETVIITHHQKLSDVPEEITDEAGWKKVRYTLSDFGTACLASTDAWSEQFDHDVTSYAARAPEVYLMAPWNAAIDMWGLGTILYQMISGNTLYPNDLVPKLYPLYFYKLFGRLPLSLLANSRMGGAWYDRQTGEPHPDLAGKIGGLMDLRAWVANLPEPIRPSSEAVDVLFQLLTVDPEKRPRAGQLLEHPWFSDLRVG